MRNENPQLWNFFSVLFQSKGTVTHNHKSENLLEGNNQKEVKKTFQFREKSSFVTPTLNHQDKEWLAVFSCPVVFLTGLQNSLMSKTNRK